MTKKVLHGNFSPNDLASLIYLHFNRENIEVHKIGSKDQVIVQIKSSKNSNSGGKTAIGINFQSFEDGVIVNIGEQKWAGIAASLGYSALAAIHNPFSLIGRIDDIAQDIENLSLEEEIWRVLENNAELNGSKFDLSDRLKRITCEYCKSANPIDAPNCISCGAPMGDLQPRTCQKCGYIIDRPETICPNCGAHV